MGARRRLGALGGVAGSLAVLAVFAAAALAFAWPWVAARPAGGTQLARYAPQAAASTILVVRYGPDGKPTVWSSQNTIVLPSARALTELRAGPRQAITAFRRGGRAEADMLEVVRGAEVAETRVRELRPDGQVAAGATTISLREARGDFLVGFYDAEADRETLFEPPAQLLSADLRPGASWSSEGTFGGSTPYRFSGSVVEAGSFQMAQGAQTDCIHVATALLLQPAAGAPAETRWRDRYCAGLGLVESVATDASDRVTSRSVVVARPGSGPVPADLLAAVPPAPKTTASPAPAPGPTADWRLERVGQAAAAVESGESTIAPVWLPSDPPAVLAASYAGDLVAFDAADPTGAALWRLRPGGTIFGPPAVDRAGGRVYFGATDKRLYALDARGLYLWSVETGDNVATRPLVAGGTVVFGSEDGGVYGVDAATGAPRWRTATGGAVVSSPALVGDAVVIGADDGFLHALDPATGQVRWRHGVGTAVEAPVAVVDGVLYAAGRHGLVALDPPPAGRAEPTVRWTAQSGQTLRSAPAVAAGRVFVVGVEGYLLAFDAAGGTRLWTSPESDYVGPPVGLGDTVLLADRRGRVRQLDGDGRVVREWTAETAAEPGRAARAADFQLGPTLGGGAVWLGDEHGTVYRLGPPVAGAARLRPAWGISNGRPPFDGTSGSGLYSSAVAYRGSALVVDSGRHVYRVDPATGAAERKATLPGDGTTARLDPVVAGDTLLVVVGQQLQAYDLAAGQPRWRATGVGQTFRPPAVADGVVLWSTGAGPAAPGTLVALDLATGQERWRTAVDSAGGAVVSGAGNAASSATGSACHSEERSDEESRPFRAAPAPLADATVGIPRCARNDIAAMAGAAYAGSPLQALDLATGAPRWSTPPGPVVLGGPALDEGGRTLYAGLLDAPTNTGFFVALDAADGRERWRVERAGDVLSPFSAPRATGDVVLFPLLSGDVLALAGSDGAERWRYRPRPTRWGEVEVAGGLAWLVQTNGRIVGLDPATGRVAARFAELELPLDAFGPTMMHPTLIGDRLVVPLSSALLGLLPPGAGS